MTGSAIVILIIKDLMPLWYGIVIIMFSFINIIGASVIIKKYKYVPSAILVGKIAAASVMFTFLSNIVAFLHQTFLSYLYIASITLIITSACIYGLKNYKIIKDMK
jgi:hypothetical protein